MREVQIKFFRSLPVNMLNTEIQFLKCWFKFKVLFDETGVGATPLVRLRLY